MSNTITVTLGGTLIAAVMFTSPVAAGGLTPVDFTNVAFAPDTGWTSIPIGAADFCRREPTACQPNKTVVQAETLTPASWSQLIAVNDAVNRKIVPETDQDNYHQVEYWTYPADGRGDCEDIALEKQRELIAAGWDPSTLLMTVVREADGNGHAVLMVRTDRGDLILDNQNGKVLLWKDTPYAFIKRQSQADAGKWVALNDDRATVITAAMN
jgi:predicted transglutaminase-like cysteine proteinase